MLLTLLTRVGPVVLGGALRVQSEVACPDPEEVSAKVQKIVDLSDESAKAVHATVRRDGNWLVLGLAGSDGTSLGERRLAYEGDCAMLARAAAVVFAAWLSNEHPEFLVGLPAEGWESQPEMPPAPAPGPSPASTAPVVPSLSVPIQTPKAPTSSAPPPPVESARRRFVLGAGVGGAAGSTAFAPGVGLSAAWDPAGRGWGARVGIAWLGARSEPLGAREVSWTRWPLVAGPFLRLRAGRSSFDLEAGGALGWARLRGHGFQSDTTDSGLTVGGYAGLRFVANDSPPQLFVMAAPLYWFHDATAVATDATSATISSRLPSFEVLLSLGAQLPL
ncbi:MAG TPA: hypothetical protein VER04_07175 [Polyangiaceae bacterium]|nr:hypothetical protein [Polyangiaceae bacterium]